MKRIILLSSFALACVLGACSSAADVTCDIIWSDADDNELGRGTIVYEELDDVDAGVDMCKEDQADEADRPSGTMKYTCNCAT